MALRHNITSHLFGASANDTFSLTVKLSLVVTFVLLVSTSTSAQRIPRWKSLEGPQAGYVAKSLIASDGTWWVGAWGGAFGGLSMGGITPPSSSGYDNPMPEASAGTCGSGFEGSTPNPDCSRY